MLTVFTEVFGRVSYAVYGVGSRRAVCRPALMQPLSVVALEVEHRPTREMQRIREMRLFHPFVDIPRRADKGTIALFLAELLYRVLPQEGAEAKLYDFLERSVIDLDTHRGRVSDFHLLFMMQLTRYLGFEPNCERQAEGFFDMLEGVFVAHRPPHAHYLTPDKARDFALLAKAEHASADTLLPWGKEQRNQLLEKMLDYYRLHVPGFVGVNSLSVLRSLSD